MWMKLPLAGTLLLTIDSAHANDCPFTVSVLDVAGVQCVSSVPCSGTYYASGLSQGVGACPTGANCALLPETPIMGCATAGRSDLIYVNLDGSLSRDGKAVTLLGEPLDASDLSTTLAPTTSSQSSPSSSQSISTSDTNSATPTYPTSDITSSSTSTISSNPAFRNNDRTGTSVGNDKTENYGEMTSNGKSEFALPTSSDSEGHLEMNNTALMALVNDKNFTSASWRSGSSSDDAIVLPDGSEADLQAFNPGSILSEDPLASEKSSESGLGIGSILAIALGCIAVVAIAVGARLLRKGTEAELVTPVAPGVMDGYNNGGGGGGGGMTPKENVLLL
ncbi:hypothetical protein CCR75_008100 [Bremia lactucae]|uniref:Uncharacterized protein n=1 Tax=Bremia lactucae TaxID=4779 RepID=A0A976FKX4_BRELC|nr:hypothetical protein CCR75_008100 [Bremia lactucae]